ncbi:hypothetical protein AA106555_0686 [Neokomagataea thailandica NBRC 106555]|uniref:Alpha/beta hydrolase n=2 Tax=Neokomagataea TaxID=1223423 RepID=A0A4Y6V357_9PROT|nr:MULTISPECIES: lipase family protein [Neokomagataea]QDH24522.1 alpha/beta hydrolase [Neokomagataea tanensis]GBR51787.1 hypothetical protein AA106555_0686 [Neokomagataea thailandica NBRC 106555]
MRHRSFALLAGFAFLAPSFAAAKHTPQHHTASTQTPGALLSSSPLAAPLSLPEAGAAFRISYTATDGVTGHGIIPVTGEVIFPAGPAPQGGWPIVAWAHGTVGLNDSCAPSLNAHSKRDATYLTAWLKRGFAIVATDYQGLGGPGMHPYLNTRAEAYSVLDAIRASLSGLRNLQNKILIVGQSQGAGAAFASAAFAPAYSPDLNIRGTVATGIPFITPQMATALVQPLPSGTPSPAPGQDPLVSYVLLIGASLGGLSPDFHPEAAFTPAAMNAYRAASETCLTGLEDDVAKEGLTRQSAFKPTLPQALAPAFMSLSYPTLHLKQPLFVGTGSADQDVPTAAQLGLVKAACAAGTTVQAHLYRGLNHSQTVNASLADSAAFTQAVMNNQPVTPICAPVAQ